MTRGGRRAGRIPVLVDHDADLVLREVREADLESIVETCTDPDTVRFTSIPTPYGMADARAFLATVRRLDAHPVWTLEAERDGVRQCCGTIGLRLEADGIAEVGYSVHPAARGRGLGAAALRLVRDLAFDHGFGAGPHDPVRVLRWRSAVGNWASRRSAAAAGFRIDGRIRSLLPQRGTLIDGWLATMLAGDFRGDRRWAVPPRLTGTGVVLRPFRDDDAARVVQACGDRRTEYWLASLPDPYTVSDAEDYIASTQEDAATGLSWSWCVADADDDRCLGAISLDGFGGYHRRSEIGYWAHPEARGRGVMSDAARVLTRYAETELERDSLIIRCAVGNTASRHVAQAAGYREAGVLIGAEPLGDGTRTDLITYARP